MKQTSFCNSITEWISIGLLPVFKILGLKYHNIYSKSYDVDGIKGGYSKINIEYDNACATLSLGIGVKSESDMRISGTKDIFIFHLHGGNLNILKHVLKIKIKINHIIINQMEKE